MNGLKPQTKKLALFRRFYVEDVAKSDIIDIIIVHPLARINGQIM